ncbi:MULTISPECIES: hypothetical protein [Burkholderia]|uniref:Cell wall surface anchor family protein n=1 Tax=Burkholderia aenigmatica TaxID=2015348 RepID=A0A6J5IPR7_9BURK|nr:MULTISPECIES: hypothetical protein [Burkholderia]CAB3961715.1 cell wall surface anchor family protein [Burkholderia aenigmatica]
MGHGNLAKPIVVATGIAVAMLAGCGGGSDSGAPSGSQNAAVSGTVAGGNPVANATITATDVNGKTATTQAGSNGAYTLNVAGLSQPIALVATDPSGQVSPLVTVLAQLPAGGQTAVANVTTLTTALAALLTPDGNPMDFVTSGAPVTLANTVTAASVSNATSTLDTYLANLLVAVGLSATYDPVATAFTADHTGADALIDLLRIIPQGAATYLAYKTPTDSAASTQQATYLTLNDTSTPSNVPIVPAVSAGTISNLVSLQNYLGTLPASLQPCLVAGGSGSACAGIIDANYKENGFTNITAYNTDLASSALGLGGSVPFLVASNQAGTTALIGIPYALSSAQGSLGQHTLYTTVQQTPSGTWDVIGNQLPYNLSVSTRATYRHFNDSFADVSTGNPDVSFFDAGATLNVGSLSGSGANISYANVSGPGLPSSGLWLTKSTVAGDNALAIAVKQPTSPPTGAFTTGTNTNEYRWDWATQSGVSFTPPVSGIWSKTRLNVATLPPNADYQFTLYNASGGVLGTYKVTNPNAFADATLAQAAFNSGYFPVLGNDVVASFLSGSGALAGTQTAVTVDFTLPPSNSPLTVTGVNVQSQDQNLCGFQQVVGVAPGTTSVTLTASGTGTCKGSTVNNSFLAVNNASDAAYRIVQLRSRNSSGILFYLNETYRSSASAPGAT